MPVKVKLTPEELEPIYVDIRAGSQEAVGKLVLHHDRYLHVMARIWIDKYKLDRWSRQTDVHSLFVLTALRVGNKFDSRISKFGTFLKFPLQSAFAEYVGKSCLPLTTPERVTQAQNRLHATVRSLQSKDVPVTFDSIMQKCNVDEKLVWEYLRVGGLSQIAISLDVIMTDEGSTLHELFASEAPSAFAVLVEDELKLLVHDALQSLSPREATIMKRRHLAVDTESLEAIAKDFNISKERVRQIEGKAFKKMRQFFCNLRLRTLSDMANV